MARNNKFMWYLIGIAIVIIAGMYLQHKTDLFAITGSETMTRTASSSVAPGATFSVTYTAQGATGTWGASIQDSVTGGCTFPAGTSLKTVMLSDEGTTKTVTVTAPSSGTCTFTGDYQYGNTAVKTFPSTVVTTCVANCNTRPTDLCLASSSNGCGGTCTWTVTKNTNSDTNCNNKVDRTELGVSIGNWVSGSVTRTDLGNAIMAWVSG